ncbi:MAG: hypothetical protein BGO90_10205 [Legionella sp. 40-6]|nr:hypothetical protein [Legionella sp.]OJY13396.1 MAG: hypothetical protein BGO90_10205 [Legionella sp. 40-6]
MYTKGVFPPSYPILQASWELAHKNKHQQALKLLLKAPEKDRDFNWSIAYSNYQYNLGNIEAAIQHLECVLQFNQQLSIKENEQKNPLTSKNFKVYSALAYNYLALNRPKEALYIFRKRANIPYLTKGPKRGLSKQSDILKVAELALEIGKNNLAITYFNRLSPGPKIIPQELTKIPPLKSSKEYHDEVFPQAKLFGLALAHERIGEIKKAFFYYAELIQRFPYYQQGLTKFYKMVQKYNMVEGFSLREQGMELFHKLADQHTNISFLQTLAAKTEQSPDNKRKSLENLQQRFPHQHEISYALARVCLKQRDYESAFSYALAYKIVQIYMKQKLMR